MSLKLVSVILPVFNQEEYLEKSLDSVISQTYENIEIVVINDGSTDKSYDILEKYSLLEKRLKVIHQQNKGLVGATISGIENSTGEYICFLDPDDYIGPNFIQNFIKQLDKDYDIIAAGFYYDYFTYKDAYYLLGNEEYDQESLKNISNYTLCEEKRAVISNRFFPSRWNKLYSMKCIQQVLNDFKKCEKVSLGEDTIFTFLAIKYSKSARILKQPNEYFYNVVNSNSMMKNDDVDKYLEKCMIAHNTFYNILLESQNNLKQADLLMYNLVNGIYVRTFKTNKTAFSYLYKKLNRNKIYQKSLLCVINSDESLKIRLDAVIRKIIKYPKIYIYIEKIVKFKNIFYNILDYWKYFKDNFKKQNIYKLSKGLWYKYQRQIAIHDMYKKISKIENRIEPFLKSFEGKETNLVESDLQKNIFIFWWDGEECLPDVVKTCIKSVKANYKEYNIVLVDKNNYKLYTDINETIQKGFLRGKISIQTFSDILRFNLLKNNGGIWIDSTVFFTNTCDLLVELENKSFTSIYFDKSRSFLEYKNKSCSWSSFFIASRKNGILVTAMDKVFEEYYLEYKTYPTYFFMDIVFMICKIKGIDNNVLDHTKYMNGDMFWLAGNIQKEFNEIEFENATIIPQKLTWFMEQHKYSGSYYQFIKNMYL